MNEPNTSQIQRCLDRLRAGDADAREDLFRSCQERLCAHTRRMLGRYPAVRRWEGTDDVFQNAVVRLDKKQTVPAQLDGYLDAIGTPVPAGSITEKDRDFVGYLVEPGKNERLPLRQPRLRSSSTPRVIAGEPLVAPSGSSPRLE